MTNRERWRREQRRYRRLALRAAAALPKRTLARTGVPAWHFDFPFDPTDRAAAAQAIRDLAAAVKDAAPRRYFRLELPPMAEHAIQARAKGRALRLVRFYDVQRGTMRTFFSVAGA